MKKVLAITSCATGVAHTYMAAEALEEAAKKIDVAIKIETHGSVGVENNFSSKDIEEAEGIIIAADTQVDRSRFSGKRIISVPVRKGIDKPTELIQRLLDGEGRVYQGDKSTTSDSNTSSDSGESVLSEAYQALMSGVSHMIPFVVTGGLMIAVALSIGGEATEAGFVIPEASFWYHINNIGGAAMSFMGPILAAYIAFAIADRPGLAPGMVGGYIAMNGYFYGTEANTGFLGAIIAGFLAGYIAKAIKKIPVPKALNSVMPIIFIPIITTLIVSLVFIYLIGQPVAGLFSALTSWLANLQGTNAIILGGILGSMIAVDMGGPFNKTAFLVGSGLIAQGEFGIMGANAVAIAIPPLATGLASYIYRNKFSEGDRSTGLAAIFMSFFGITEGAIPFAAKNPLVVIPSIVAGSAVGGAIAMVTDVGGHVAHGGPIVAILGAIDNVMMFFIALLIGAAISVVLIGLFMPKLNTEETESNHSKLNQDDESTSSDKSTNESPNQSTAKTINLIELTDDEFIHMDIEGSNKEEVLQKLLNHSKINEYVSDTQVVLDAATAREAQGTTGMGDGIAIPHAKSEAIKEPLVMFARSNEGIDWESLDDSLAKIIFFILVPENQKGDLHLKILQKLSRHLMHDDFKQALLEANSKDDIKAILRSVE